MPLSPTSQQGTTNPSATTEAGRRGGEVLRLLKIPAGIGRRPVRHTRCREPLGDDMYRFVYLAPSLCLGLWIKEPHNAHRHCIRHQART